jgi:hypothetical protein
VIAIIAILAAILFPVFAQAREKARQTSCLSNLKQHALSTALYVQDYDETFPLALYLSNQSPAQCGVLFYQALVPYQKSADIERCPSDTSPFNIDQAVTNLSPLLGGPISVCPAQPQLHLASYQPNYAVMVFPTDLSSFIQPPVAGNAVTLAQLPYPTDTSLAVDGQITAGILDPNFTFLLSSPVQMRHLSQFNCVLTDGHARSIHARPYLDASGKLVTVGSLDGQTFTGAIITDAGPYASPSNPWPYQMRGIPDRKGDGSWCLQNFTCN